RAFAAWLVGRDDLGSSKDLTRDEAARILDRLGGGENGSYRTDEGKVADAVLSWQEATGRTQPEPAPAKPKRKAKVSGPIDPDDEASFEDLAEEEAQDLGL